MTASKINWDKLEQVLSWGGVLLAGVNLLGVLVLMVWRAVYPFELEWIESATVTSSQWILAGHFLYERPSLDFVPLLYSPLYFYLSAALSALTGPGFLAPRLVSILASMGCGFVIFELVRRETGHWPGALIAAGFYAATFNLTGVWMDVARSDSLLLFWLLLAAYWARWVEGWQGAVGTALYLAMAYFTKQSALPFFVAWGGFYLLQPRREWRIFLPLLFVLVVGATLLIDYWSGGWFSFYTWYVVSQHVLDAQRIWAFWTLDLFPNVLLALIVGGLGVALLGNPFSRSLVGSRSRFYLALTAGAFVSSWWNRAAAGAHTNTLFSLMACLGVLIGVAIGFPKPTRWGRWVQSAVLVGVIVQFGWLVYDPRGTLPTTADRQAGEAFLEQIRAYPGEVFIPAHTYYPFMAGKPTHAHWASITDTSGIWDTNVDVQRGGVNDPRRAIILEEVQQAIAQQRFSAIILDDIPKELDNYWTPLLAPYYQLDQTVFTDPNVFWTVSGAHKRPQLIYVPK